MPLLLQLDASPVESQVAIIDATWQDYPRWEPGQRWVVYLAPSLIHPDRPPFSGVAGSDPIRNVRQPADGTR